MYTKEQIQGNKETDKDKAVGLFVLNGDRKMSYLSLNNISCVEKRFLRFSLYNGSLVWEQQSNPG